MFTKKGSCMGILSSISDLFFSESSFSSDRGKKGKMQDTFFNRGSLWPTDADDKEYDSFGSYGSEDDLADWSDADD